MMPRGNFWVATVHFEGINCALWEQLAYFQLPCAFLHHLGSVVHIPDNAYVQIQLELGQASNI
jgi:hypothetical protein